MEKLLIIDMDNTLMFSGDAYVPHIEKGLKIISKTLKLDYEILKSSFYELDHGVLNGQMGVHDQTRTARSLIETFNFGLMLCDTKDEPNKYTQKIIYNILWELGTQPYTLSNYKLEGNVLKSLEYLHGEGWLLEIVTRGQYGLQKTKAEYLDLLSYVQGFTCVSEDKTDAYKKLFKKYNPFALAVVGDSISHDLLPALDLKPTHLLHYNRWSNNPKYYYKDYAKDAGLDLDITPVQNWADVCGTLSPSNVSKYKAMVT